VHDLPVHFVKLVAHDLGGVKRTARTGTTTATPAITSTKTGRRR
jgi:hypothetical protein